MTICLRQYLSHRFVFFFAGELLRYFCPEPVSVVHTLGGPELLEK